MPGDCLDEKPLIDIGISDDKPAEESPQTDDGDVINIDIDESKEEAEVVEAEAIDAEAIDAVAVEAETVEATTGVVPEKPVRKRKRFNKKRLLPVAIIILALFGAIFLPRFVLPSRVSAVSVKAYDKPDDETIAILLTVETSQFSRPYTGPVKVEVENGGTTKALSFTVNEGDALVTLDYEDFYSDNGNYLFTIKAEGMSGSFDFELEKTCHYIDFQNTQVLMGEEEVRVAFDLLSSVSGQSLATKGISGNGTIIIYNGTTTSDTQEVQRDYFLVDGSFYHRTNRPSETYRGTYNFTMDFSTWAWTIYNASADEDEYVNNIYTARVYFYSDLPNTDPKVFTTSDKSFTIDPMAP
jgi:hypothetical protein